MYYINEKIIHNTILKYDTYKAVNLEDMSSVTIKLYLRSAPDTT